MTVEAQAVVVFFATFLFITNLFILELFILVRNLEDRIARRDK
jgi:hypothetical protein